MPLVSVLMTVYNREKYITEAIESVLSSTYQNWELIIVDDQSADNSVGIAKSYEKKDKRIKVFINETNLGDYPNRNKAASYAKGKYIKYVDADDIIYPFGLEQFVYYMERYPDAGYGLLTKERDNNRFLPYLLGPKEAYATHYLKYSIFDRAPLSAIINRELFMKIGGFTGNRQLGDFELWHLLSYNSPVLLMPIGMVAYRSHDEQESYANRTDPFIPFKYLIFSLKALNDKKCPLDKKTIKKIIPRLENVQAKAIVSAFLKHSIKKGFQLYHESDFNLLKLLRSLIKK